MLLPRLRFYVRLLQLLARNRVVPPHQIQEDYDRLSPTYDDYFSIYVAPHSVRLVQKLAFPPGSRVLDLACGTGTLTLALARSVGETGMVFGLDRSPGMLAMAESKARRAGLTNVRFVQADMRDALPLFPAAGLDGITCGWAIGYSNPRVLIAAAASRLKSGGKLGIIENRRNTLGPVRRAALGVAQALPGEMRQVMDLHLRLPTGRRHLESLFRSAGLIPVDVWEGGEKFTFRSGAKVLDWVLHTGASAGFDKVMASEARRHCDELFARFIERDSMRDGRIEVAHWYVAGIAEKAGC